MYYLEQLLPVPEREDTGFTDAHGTGSFGAQRYVSAGIDEGVTAQPVRVFGGGGGALGRSSVKQSQPAQAASPLLKAAPRAQPLMSPPAPALAVPALRPQPQFRPMQLSPRVMPTRPLFTPTLLPMPLPVPPPAVAPAPGLVPLSALSPAPAPLPVLGTPAPAAVAAAVPVPVVQPATPSTAVPPSPAWSAAPAEHVEVAWAPASVAAAVAAATAATAAANTAASAATAAANAAQAAADKVNKAVALEEELSRRGGGVLGSSSATLTGLRNFGSFVPAGPVVPAVASNARPQARRMQSPSVAAIEPIAVVPDPRQPLGEGDFPLILGDLARSSLGGLVHTPALSSRSPVQASRSGQASYTPVPGLGLVLNGGHRSFSPPAARGAGRLQGLAGGSLAVLPAGATLGRSEDSAASLGLLAAASNPFVSVREASRGESYKDGSQVILASSMSMASIDNAAAGSRMPFAAAMGGSGAFLASAGSLGLATNGEVDAAEHGFADRPLEASSLPKAMERRPLSPERIVASPRAGAVVNGFSSTATAATAEVLWHPLAGSQTTASSPSALLRSTAAPLGAALPADPLDPLLEGSRLMQLNDKPFQAMSSIARRAHESLLERLSPRRCCPP
eukprot:TRINITY_DN6235_c0_g1_i1.p1 TRINITY_DN6235_c0_g1~~TRINITY_DN6235_c0_g1_i1.p1  ORF type:complete len:622 (-),score=150.20 TRINITY_DN6235_c0_g1_i1:245-2110(-)